MLTEAQLNSIKEKYSDQLLRTPGVSGVGVGRNESGNWELVVHTSAGAGAPADLEDLRSELTRQGVPVRIVRDGPFQRRN